MLYVINLNSNMVLLILMANHKETKVMIKFKFQYGSTNIIYLIGGAVKDSEFKFQYGSTNIDTVECYDISTETI